VGIEIWRSTGTLVQNNIFFENRKTISFWNVKHPEIDYNLYDLTSEIRGPHDIAGDPQFVNALRGIYWLSEKSSAIGRGNPDVAPQSDLWGNPRPKGRSPDLGAYQYIRLPASDRRLDRWQYSSRFETPASGEMPDLWQRPKE
jgi:hypothetical protein